MGIDKTAQHVFHNNKLIIQHLKESRLFNHLPDNVLDQLIPLSKMAQFPKGSVILAEEEENDAVYFLMTGSVSIQNNGEEILKLKRTGDMFGEMSIISQKPTLSSVIAEEDVDLFSIKASAIGKNTDINGDSLQNIFYRLFATILTDKLALTTSKAQKFEKMNGELQEMQRRLIEAKNSAEAANRSKGTFLANMSHEVRTPMNGIMGITSLLLESPLSDKQYELTKIIDKSAKSLLNILNDILDYSKIEAGELLVESSCFNMGAALKEVFDLLKVSAKEKDLEFYSKVDPLVPGLIIGDPLRLRQILLNLISNAIKFTEEGEVSVDVTVEEKNEKKIVLKFLVKDTGIGISDQHLDCLFESFSQVDGSSTRRYGGTGLGLAIANQLVQLMGGQIYVKSEEGIGSEFWFTLGFNLQDERRTFSGSLDVPERPQTRVDDILLEIPDSVKKEIRILLVEDDKVNQMVALFTLKRLGFDIDAVDNGLECLKALKKTAYDIIFMDIQMPGMDGYEATHQIRDINTPVTNHNVPIIAITAHAMKGDRERCLKEGMNDYISKPINQNELNIVLNRWLGSQKSSDPSKHQKESIESIVDLEAYSALKDSIGDISYVMKAFVSDLPEKIKSIRNSVRDNNPIQLELYAHPLKANCRTLGIIKLGDLCEEIEYFGRSGELDKAQELFIDIEREANRVIRILEKEI